MSETEFTISLSKLNIRVVSAKECARRLCRRHITDGPADLEFRMTEAAREDMRRILAESSPDEKRDQDEFQVEALSLLGGIAARLPDYDRLFLHGSALSYKGEGVVFIALSGTGKSTHSRLWREAFDDDVTMIDDDKPILEIGEGGVTVWGTPWNGKHRLGSTGGAPLKAIVLLKRGERTRVRPVTPHDAYESFFYQFYIPDDEARLKKTLELIDRVTEKVGLYELETTMDPEAAIISRNGIFGE